ncbi:unnamed protein product [Parajaminaea phylloscopi]
MVPTSPRIIVSESESGAPRNGLYTTATYVRVVRWTGPMAIDVGRPRVEPFVANCVPAYRTYRTFTAV